MTTADVLLNISLALITKFREVDGGGTHNTLYTLLNGQLFEDEAPEASPYPYGIYFIISSPKDRTFSEEYRNTLVQMSLFSDASFDSREIHNAFQYAKDLFEECSLSISGSTLVWMKMSSYEFDIGEYTTDQGIEIINECYITWEILTSLD